MRRRPREAPPELTPPAELLTYTGTRWSEARAWLNARRDWWDGAHPVVDELTGERAGDLGVLEWIWAGHDQVGNAPYCGAHCGSPDCCCTDYYEVDGSA